MMKTPTEPGRLSASDWRDLIARAPLEFEVISDSMRPTFQRGDHVRIRPLGVGEPLPGQVIAFHRGMLITHRYLGHARCRGDNTITIDRDLRDEEIVGIVHAIRRDGQDLPIPRHSRIRMALRHARLYLALFRRKSS